jgi:lipopolysaccharide/colanic/teichoic acid biosynthesis glycosyltransferase
VVPIPGRTMNVTADRPRLLNVVTSALMVGKLPGQLQYLHERGFDVTIISPGGEGLDQMARHEGVRAIEMPMARQISPLRDVMSLWRLARVMRALRPTITNVGTPKAGLLGGLAAWLNRVPCRVYTLRGLRFETTKGLKRFLLISAEKLACRFAHRVICVSYSLREKAIDAGLTSREKTVVFGSGSSNGVDVQRFSSTPDMMRRAADLRCELGIPAAAPVLGYVGRLTRDKGIPELTEAFLVLGNQFPDLRLLLVGRFEDEDPLPVETRRHLETNANVILAGHQKRQRSRQVAHQRRDDWPVDDAAPYYALMDVFVLPSHREGLPNVVLEAQAVAKPVVAARATGVLDAVIDGQTGLLFPIGDVAALADAVTNLLQNKDLAHKLSRAAQKRVHCEFRQEQIWEALHQEYLALLQTRNLLSSSKRMLDVVASGIALILLSPLIALVALAIRTCMGRPILFRQLRPGYQANPFAVYKFRTLTNACDSEGNLLPDADRLTLLGGFLRRWSLDELPQLWNVVKGDMSLVGPRPLLMEYLEKYTPEQGRRHDVRPGLTGWAQLHGRQNLIFSKRLEMDVWYVDNWSFLLDLKLMCLTLLSLHQLSAVGASPGLEKTDDLGLTELLRKRKKHAGPVSLS